MEFLKCILICSLKLKTENRLSKYLKYFIEEFIHNFKIRHCEVYNCIIYNLQPLLVWLSDEKYVYICNLLISYFYELKTYEYCSIKLKVSWIIINCGKTIFNAYIKYKSRYYNNILSNIILIKLWLISTYIKYIYIPI